MGILTARLMLQAFSRLDTLLAHPVELIMGGGGAMILAHQFPLGTADVDAIAKGIDVAELDLLVKQIAVEQSIPGDWLNPYFSTFSYTLPRDYHLRLIEVFKGSSLCVMALGKEDMLVMKCFAHRQKDIGHAQALIKKGANLEIVEQRLRELNEKRIPGVQDAVDFLDDLLEQIG